MNSSAMKSLNVNHYQDPQPLIRSRSRLTRRFVVDRHRKKIHRKREIGATLVDFANNTSLLGINLTYRNKSLAWALAYAICLTASIVQSWTVTQEFFEHKTTQSFLIRNLRVLPFPSVTVCNQQVLPDGFNLSGIHGFNTTTLELRKHSCKSKDDERLLELLIEQNREIVVQYLRKLNTGERRKLFQEHDDFIQKCAFCRRACNVSTHINTFYNPFHGTCFTYNPAFGDYPAIESDMHAQLLLILKLNKGYRLTGRQMRAAVLIHPPGTTPVLDSPGVQIVYSHQTLDISLRLHNDVSPMLMSAVREVHGDSKLQEYESRPCLIMNPDHEASLITTDKLLSYDSRNSLQSVVEWYTRDPLNIPRHRQPSMACMRSCEQKLIGTTCHLINPSLPLQAPEYEATVNTSLPPLECDLEESIDTESCDCPLPCNITQYMVTIDSAEYQYTRCNETDEDEMNRTEKGETSKARVTVNFLTNTCEKIEERFVHGWPEFLGFLGGNMSLWTGMCVLSIMELVELAIKLLLICFKGGQRVDHGWTEPTATSKRPSSYKYIPHRQPKAFTDYTTVYR